MLESRTGSKVTLYILVALIGFLLGVETTAAMGELHESGCCITCNGQAVCGCAVVTICGQCLGCGETNQVVERLERKIEVPSKNYYRGTVSREVPFLISFWESARWAGELWIAVLNEEGADLPEEIKIHLLSVNQVKFEELRREYRNLAWHDIIAMSGVMQGRQAFILSKDPIRVNIGSGSYVIVVDWSKIDESVRNLDIEAHVALEASRIGPSIVPLVEGDPDQ